METDQVEPQMIKLHDLTDELDKDYDFKVSAVRYWEPAADKIQGY